MAKEATPTATQSMAPLIKILEMRNQEYRPSTTLIPTKNEGAAKSGNKNPLFKLLIWDKTVTVKKEANEAKSRSKQNLALFGVKYLKKSEEYFTYLI